MLIENFANAIQRWLRVPPGASIRNPGDASGNAAQTDNDYLDAILDITVDDICIGDAPVTILAKKGSSTAQKKFDQLALELNSIVHDVARDLCSKGFSVWSTEFSSEENRLFLFPFTEPVEFYITNRKKIVASHEDKLLKNLLIFINYNSSSYAAVTSTDADSIRFKVQPIPMQFKKVANTVASLNRAENNLDRYRTTLSRIARWVNVDVGVSQGADQKDVVDTISSAINANSESLSSVSTGEFDDNIPVLPNRRGLGKAELASDIPNYNLSELGDLNYYTSKLNLLTRFPASYADFSKSLDQTAVSLVRGDVRYAKLCTKVRTKIESTINNWLYDSKLAKYQPVCSLTTNPSSEDEDVMASLDNYTDLTAKIEDYVMAEGSHELRLHRLALLRDLTMTSTNSPKLVKWFDDYEAFINTYEEAEESGEVDSDSPGLGGGMSGLSDLEGSSGPELPDETSPDVEINPDLSESAPDVEFVEPSTL